MSLLSVEGIDSYYGNSHVLHDLSLEVGRNEIVALLGRNGAGKTTTFRSVSGIVEPREGRVMFDDEDVVGLRIDQISDRGIKLVPEDRRVFPTLTVHENLTVARRQSAAEPRTIDDMYDLFPKLGELRNSRGQNLSGGEQQMLSVARALIQSPKLLLLDEPTEGLAPVIVDDLRESFEDIVEQDITILLSEQNVEFAFDLAERAYIIEKGANVFEGTIDELRDQPELLEHHLSVSAAEAD